MVRVEEAGAAELLGKRLVLLVEDVEEVRKVVRRQLAGLGLNVIEAESGNEAADMVEHIGEIALVLSDVVMPGGMNGLELARQLLQKNPKLKVVYASGYSAGISSQDPDLTLQEGVNFIAKPFDSQKLAKILRHCLDS